MCFPLPPFARLLRRAAAFALVVASVLVLTSCSAGTKIGRFDRVLKAVVRLDTVVRTYSNGRAWLRRGTGAGVVVSPSGEVVTNYHVAAGAIRIRAVLSDGRELAASVVGLDPWTDLALLNLENAGRTEYVGFGDSDSLSVGDEVFAVGSPRGLSHTVNRGIVSAVRRFLADEMYFEDGAKTGLFTAWIQTDALVEPGSSGGPLLDSRGRVVGIVARSFRAGSGFAVPSRQVAAVVEQLRSRGEVVRGTLGVRWGASADYLEALGEEGAQGPLVLETAPDSPLAGVLRSGDVVSAIAGRRLRGGREEDLPLVREFVSSLEPGRGVKIRWFRPGKGEMEALVKVGELSPAAGPNAECRAWGLTVRGITPCMMWDLDLPDTKGVLVTGVRDGGPAAAAGIGAAFVIRSVEGRPVEGFEDFMRLYRSTIEKGEALVTASAGKFRTMALLRFPAVREEGR